MAIVCLAKVSPMNPATGSRVDLYAASAQDRSITGLNGVVWEPAVVGPPTLSINLWQGDFKEPVDTGGASFAINMGVLKNSYPNADTYNWAGAPVEIYAEESGAAWPWAKRFKGRVANFNRRSDVITVNATIETEAFDKNILTATYGGTGGVEGSADLKGRLKPLVIGWAQNVEPVLIDAVNNVYQFSGYGAIEGVSVLYERAASFGAPIADHATYAALVAATVPAGRWATCLAAGLVRLGAPAAGVITGDVRGHKVGIATPRLTGSVIGVLANIAGVSAADIETATLSALDAAVPYPINLVLTEQSTFRDMASILSLACNWQSGITLAGKFFVLAVNLSGSEVITFNAQGRALPQVITSDESDVSVPYYQTVFGAGRCWRVHTADEIAFTAALVPLGRYSNDTTYREGNIVDLADGSTWLYINATPSAGNPPPAWPGISNAHWASMTPRTTAMDIVYDDGTPLEELKPAQPGATAGAPHGTTVGGRLAQDVVQDLDFNAETMLQQTLRGDAFQELLLTRTLIDGRGVGTVFAEFAAEQQAQNDTFTNRFSLLGAEVNGGAGWILNAQAVQIQLDGESSTRTIQQLALDVNGHSSEIEDLRDIVVDPSGATVRSMLRLTNEGYISGLIQTNGGPGRSTAAFLVDSFAIVDPNGGSPRTPFAYSDGVIKMGAVEVDTLKVGTGGTSSKPSIVSSSTAIGGSGVYVEALGTTVIMDGPGTVYVSVSAGQSFPNGDKTWNCQIEVDGQVLAVRGGTITADSVSIQAALYFAAAGTRTVKFKWNGQSGCSIASRNMFAIAYYGS